jgi:hypothetical protein
MQRQQKAILALMMTVLWSGAVGILPSFKGALLLVVHLIQQMVTSVVLGPVTNVQIPMTIQSVVNWGNVLAARGNVTVARHSSMVLRL